MHIKMCHIFSVGKLESFANLDMTKDIDHSDLSQWCSSIFVSIIWITPAIISLWFISECFKINLQAISADSAQLLDSWQSYKQKLQMEQEFLLGTFALLAKFHLSTETKEQ